MRSDAAGAHLPLTVAVTGSTGLIGSALVARLRSRGHTVRRVLRSARDAGPADVVWNPDRGELDAKALGGVDAVINLAGEPIARRWTAARKQAIRDSRVRATELLARTIAGLQRRPRVFLSGSAVGFYGDRGDEVLDEASAPGTDFLSRVTAEWEAATGPAVSAGIRVVTLRTGVVLSPQGGALAKLLPVFRLGAGGPLGSGRQWISWISLDDHLRATEHALITESFRGPANLVAPNPVTSAQLAETLGRVLSRPAIAPVPAFALELLYGEMARATLLASQRAMPVALSAAGFKFEGPRLEGALRAMLQR